jgi:hypothetical protein
MIRLLLLMVPIAALAGCKTESAAYCTAHPGVCSPFPPGDGSSGGQCKSDGDCKTADFPACELTIDQGTCKPCSASNIGACAGTTPRCENNACVACVDDGDCSGGAGVCLPTGDCAATSRIIYAASTSGTSTKCSDVATPCSLNGALGFVTADKDVIKLDDRNKATFASAPGFVVSKNVTIDARGATLNRSDPGPIITVMGGKSLTLLGGTIQSAHGGMGSGILCNDATVTIVSMGADPAPQATMTMNEQFGIDATNCTLSLTKARIEKNNSTGIRVSGGSISLVRSWLDTNNGGGADIKDGAQFTIVGNVFANNGVMAGIIGGINIATIASANRLEFNSFSENKTQATIAAGVICSANAGFVAKNNIIWSNNSFVAGMAGLQVSGGCGHSYSDIGPLPITGPTDMGSNQHIDPMFKDQVNDLHLTSTSPLQLQQSDPGTNLGNPTDPAVTDIDGEPRVAPIDIGADQYYPPMP